MYKNTQEVIRAAVRPGMTVIHQGKAFKAVKQSGKNLHLRTLCESLVTSDIFVTILVDQNQQPITD